MPVALVFKDSPEGGTSFASWSRLEKKPGHQFLLETVLWKLLCSFVLSIICLSLAVYQLLVRAQGWVRKCRRSGLREQIKSEINVTEKPGFLIYKCELSCVQDKNNTCRSWCPFKKNLKPNQKNPKDGNMWRFSFFKKRSQIELLKIEVKSQLHFRVGGVQEEPYHRQQRGLNRRNRDTEICC